MDPEQQLTFDAEGYVRMDAFPDVDPDTALAPAELARLHDALVADAPPDSLLESWDAVVDAVDELVPGDLIDILPDEAAFTSGPINLFDGAHPATPASTADRSSTDEPDASVEPDADGTPIVPLEADHSSSFADHGTELHPDDDPALAMLDDDPHHPVDDVDDDTFF